MTVLTSSADLAVGGISRLRATAAITAVVLGAAAASLITVTSTATSTAGQAADASRPLAGTSEYMENVVNSVQAMGESRFPSIFGAAEVTGGGGHVVVFLTSLSPTAEAQLSGVARAGTVSFARTSHTETQLLATHAAVTKDAAALRTQGIDIVSWFPGVNGDGLEHIGVVGLTAAKARVLDQVFGPGRIALQALSSSQAPELTASRVDDYSPWNGGDNLTAGTGSTRDGCTSGAGVTYQGVQYMITAAHCYEPGWKIYNEFPLVSRPGNYMGTETSRDITKDGDDTALVRMPVEGHVWTGIIGKPVPEPVAGDATNPDGDIVYNEGAYSGEVADTVVNNYLGCASFTGYTGVSGSRTECNLVEATSGGIANQEGDSGAPVIRYIGGKLMVTGIVSGASGTAFACEYNTQYETKADSCYHIVYYTAMDEILSTEYPGAKLVG